MRKLKKITISSLAFCCLLVALTVFSTGETVTISLKKTTAISPTRITSMETFVKKQMEKGNIPGMAITIVIGDQIVYRKGFGFADTDRKIAVSPTTLFELGSTSKAFTGLAILKLANEGKINLDDPITKYFPWLKLKYRGTETTVTVAQFLHQTSGIPYESIGSIPVADDANALEETVRTIAGTELTHRPGSRFFYATINYDVLGLLIQKVSGLSYEEYMHKNILTPLGLKNTCLFRSEAQAGNMAKGYKMFLGNPSEYDAPPYRGNTPAGYIISNIVDLGLWLQYQMGAVQPPEPFKLLIEQSHQSDPALRDSDYAVGWKVFSKRGQISHEGANPNFSSYIGFSTLDKLGVVVLCNINSSFTSGTANGIMTIIRGDIPKASYKDMNSIFDDLAIKVLLVFCPLMLLGLVFLVRSIRQIVQQGYTFSPRRISAVTRFAGSTILLVLFAKLLYDIPAMLGFSVPWSFVKVWVPLSFIYAVVFVFLAGFVYYILYMSVVFFPRPRKKPKAKK